MRKVLLAAGRIFWKYGDNKVTVTSGTDGAHGIGSYHYYGYALDLRTWAFSDDVKKLVLSDMKKELGEDYDVILHGDSHLHIEFDVERYRKKSGNKLEGDRDGLE